MAIWCHFGDFRRLLATNFLPKIAKNLAIFLAIFRKAKILIFDHIKQVIFTLDVYILGLKTAFDIDIWSL